MLQIDQNVVLQTRKASASSETKRRHYYQNDVIMLGIAIMIYNMTSSAPIVSITVGERPYYGNSREQSFLGMKYAAILR